MSRARRDSGMPKMSTSMFRLKQKFTMLRKSEKAAICLRLSVPSTLIRHKNVAFQKRFFKAEDFEKAGFVL